MQQIIEAKVHLALSGTFLLTRQPVPVSLMGAFNLSEYFTQQLLTTNQYQIPMSLQPSWQIITFNNNYYIIIKVFSFVEFFPPTKNLNPYIHNNYKQYYRQLQCVPTSVGLMPSTRATI